MSNWIDRGDPAEPKLARALHHVVGRDIALQEEILLGHAATILGMVAADASEIQVAAYIGDAQESLCLERAAGRVRHLAAIALWHIGKAAIVRDHSARVLAAVREASKTEQPGLAEWLKERLMNDELP